MIITAESVSPHHPDKLCDRISDAILDACLEQDPNARCAIETMGGHGIITITGEMTTEAFVDVPEVVKKIVGNKYGVQTNIVRQSPDIAKGVDGGGAGDQGVMVGYACDETPELMPREVMLARSLNRFIYDRSFKSRDGKTQITLDTVSGDILAIVASFEGMTTFNLTKEVKIWMEAKNIECSKIYINPAGDWAIGGFNADTGVTGRKLAVDNYGPRIPIGGGAFSGKDATKVDRSAAYMARKIAVDIQRSNSAHEVFVYLSYAIGKADPIQMTTIIDGIEKNLTFDSMAGNCKPEKIIEILKLTKPQFEETARWGHFGNNFEWDN